MTTPQPFVNTAAQQAIKKVWDLASNHVDVPVSVARNVEALINEALYAARKDERALVAAELKAAVEKQMARIEGD